MSKPLSGREARDIIHALDEHDDVLSDREARAVETFLSTLGDLTCEEALANVELDARSYGWSRFAVRTLASKVRLHFARLHPANLARKPEGTE